MTRHGRIDDRPQTFATLTIRVPAGGVVRVPAGGYPHEFASVPNGWREVAGVRAQYISVPVLTRPLPVPGADQ